MLITNYSTQRMESRQGQTDDYAPPLPPRPQKQKNNVCENIHDLWTKIPKQLQPIVKISLIVLGCILALVIAFLIGYDAAKSKYQVIKTSDTSTVQTTINSIDTDEGVLEPFGIGEMICTIQY